MLESLIPCVEYRRGVAELLATRNRYAGQLLIDHSLWENVIVYAMAEAAGDSPHQVRREAQALAACACPPSDPGACEASPSRKGARMIPTEAVRRVRRTDPGTSFEAAVMADGLARSQQYAVLTALIEAKRPLGAEEIADAAGMGLTQQGSGFPS